MKQKKNEVKMGLIANIFIPENLKKPEIVFDFVYEQIRASSTPAELFCTLRNCHPSIEEMMMIKEEITELNELRLECSIMPSIKSWWKGTKRELKNAENETLDIRRFCQYCVYWFFREGNKTQEAFIREFTAHTCGH